MFEASALVKPSIRVVMTGWVDDAFVASVAAVAVLDDKGTDRFSCLGSEVENSEGSGAVADED